MNQYEGKTYDVVIVGGGPAGATLGARLKRETNLDVAIFEAEYFPRDHIGETFVHTIVPSLMESGALGKVLASECWVKKFGGFYSWDPKQPWITYFEHALHEKDGYFRWAIHCNRPEFDQILLDHAKSCGVEVFEGTPVMSVRREGDITRLDLGCNGEAKGRIFVNCSGRWSHTTITGDRAFLSEYRNVAVWNHVVNGKPAQTLNGDWNFFREKNLSPVGSLAFEDGWFWYIPVPKMIQGKRVRTHSIGLVTDPSALNDPGKKFTDPKIFLETARKVPLLKDLIQDAEFISDKFSTAPNYSRISGRMCDWEAREIRVGDAAYFVDPLFSSGVHFALQHAGMALALIKAAFDPKLTEVMKKELWEDYHQSLVSVARGFALGIDQWYNEIARDNPNSVYWKHRGGKATFDTRSETFQALVNGQIHGDLIQVITKGTNSINSLGKEGPLRATLDKLKDHEPAFDAKIRLKSNIKVKESLTLESPMESPDGRKNVFMHGPYWDDPFGRQKEVMPLIGEPTACHRLYFNDGSSDQEVKFVEAQHKGLDLVNELKSGQQTYGNLVEKISPVQKHLLLHMALTGMVETSAAGAA